MIQVWLDTVDPLTGSARLQPDRTNTAGPSTSFVGWLGLLYTLSDLIALGQGSPPHGGA